MKKTNILFKIAKVELKMIFSTPVAWLMLIVFTVLCGLFFTDALVMFTEAQAGSHLSFITQGLFNSDMLGLFPRVKTYLYLFIPLVTMGMLSRDLSSGTIKLLYSSPVTDAQIVLGKFVAMMGYGLAMIGALVPFVVFAGLTVEHMDLPMVLTGLLGLYLLICTYSAIGIFMSSQTSYQVVAALSTFAVLAALAYVRSFGQSVPWLRDITYWLSLNGRCEEFVRGMICSEDLIYFIIVPAFFLTLAVLRLSNRRNRRSGVRRWGGYAAAALVTVTVGFLSSRPALMCFYDSTETKKLSITPPSQEVMNRVKGPVVMTSYVNILDDGGFYLGVPSRYNSDKAYIKQYLRFKPDIHIRYVYYWADTGSPSIRRRFPDLTDEQRAERLADAYEVNFDRFLSPEEVAREVDLSDEEYRLVRRIELSDGRSTFLRIFDDSQRLPQEKEITAAFKRLIDGAVQVGFLAGHDERDIWREADDAYFVFANAKSFRHSLLNNGFDSRIVTISEDAGIPDDISLLIIADPRRAFSDREIAEIERYVASGRNLILAVEPGRQQYANRVAELFGARFDEGRMVVAKGEQEQNLVLARFTPEASREFHTLRSLRRHDYRVTMPNAAGVTVDDGGAFSAAPLLVSDSLGWNELQTVDFVNETAEFDPAKGECIGPRSVAYRLTRSVPSAGREQKVLLLGDADCFSNGELMRQRYDVAAGNFTLLYEMFRWLSDGQYPIDTPRPDGSDNKLHLSVESLVWVRWGLVALIPLLLLLGAIFIIVRRKSK